MKKSISRVLSFMLALMLIVSLASCTSKKPSSSNSSSKTVNLKICVRSLPAIKDMNTNDFTKWMENKTGVHVTWSYVPNTGTEEKLQLLLNSGDLPDVFMSTNMSTTDLAKYGSDQGMFVQLDNYLAKDAPNLTKALAASTMPDGLNAMRMPDGYIYSMPVLDLCQHCELSTKMWLYDPWMQKLNLQTPKTTADFENVLKAFKTQDPNGNGKADEIALDGNARLSGWHDSVDEFLLNAFVYYDRANDGFLVQDKTVKNSLNTDQYKEGLQYLNKLYKEGLIYSNSFTQDNTALVAEVMNPNAALVGAVPAGHNAMFGQAGSDRDMGYRPISPLKGPEGVQQSPLLVSYAEPTNGEYVISKSCKNIDAAIKYADIMYTQEATLDIRAGGPQDVFWRPATSSELDFNGKPAVWFPIKPWNDTNPQNQSWLEVGVWNFTTLRTSEETNSSVDLWSAEGMEYMLYKVTTDLYQPYVVNNCLPPLSFASADADKVAQVKTELETFIDSSQFNFITGQASFDKDWSKYVSDLNKLINQLTPIYQKTYNSEYNK